MEGKAERIAYKMLSLCPASATWRCLRLKF